MPRIDPVSHYLLNDLAVIWWRNQAMLCTYIMP